MKDGIVKRCKKKKNLLNGLQGRNKRKKPWRRGQTGELRVANKMKENKLRGTEESKPVKDCNRQKVQHSTKSMTEASMEDDPKRLWGRVGGHHEVARTVTVKAIISLSQTGELRVEQEPELLKEYKGEQKELTDEIKRGRKNQKWHIPSTLVYHVTAWATCNNIVKCFRNKFTFTYFSLKCTKSNELLVVTKSYL